MRKYSASIDHGHPLGCYCWIASHAHACRWIMSDYNVVGPAEWERFKSKRTGGYSEQGGGLDNQR